MGHSEEHIWYDEHTKEWVVGHDIVVYLPLDDSGLLKRFVIEKGFRSDLGSIPRLFWAIIAPFEIGVIDAITHDWSYKNQIDCRAWCDWVLLKAMRDNKIAWWKRKSVYGLVRTYGRKAWNRHAANLRNDPASPDEQL